MTLIWAKLTILFLLKLMHEKLKNSPFIAPEDAKNIANDEDNLLLTSRRVNNAKRAKTNAEFAEDSDFLKKKGLPVFIKNERQLALGRDKGRDKGRH